MLGVHSVSFSAERVYSLYLSLKRQVKLEPRPWAKHFFQSLSLPYKMGQILFCKY